MKLKQINLLRSFSTRLSLFIFLVSASVFIITFVAYYGSARSEVEEEAAKHAPSMILIDEFLKFIDFSLCKCYILSHCYFIYHTVKVVICIPHHFGVKRYREHNVFFKHSVFNESKNAQVSAF